MNFYVFFLIALFIGCVSNIICKKIEEGVKRCCHVWDTLNTNEIVVMDGYDKIKQTVEIKSCKLCGHLVRVNLTSGHSDLIARGGTPHDQPKLM